MTNIEALLARLAPTSLAHDLVSVVRGLPADQWDTVLRERIRSLIQEETTRVRDAANSEP